MTYRAYNEASKAAAMNPGQINMRLDKIDSRQSELTDIFIRIGLGSCRLSEIAKLDDPLAIEYVKLSQERNALKDEIDLRYGPGAPSRLPIRKGFGPRA